MKKTFKAQIIFRYALIAACILIFSGAIIGEVIDTTITNKEHWNEKADSILKQRKVIYPKRGDILACDGSVLATNVTTYTVRIDYRSEQFKEKEYVLWFLSSKNEYFVSEISSMKLDKSILLE